MYALSCLIATQFDLNGLAKYHIVGTYGEEVLYSLITLLIPQVIYMCKDIFKKRIVPMSVVLFMPLLYISSGIALYIVCISAPDLG